ncbi:zinc finger, CCHC-type containing protein, partial [Tanacetum coccineum]
VRLLDPKLKTLGERGIKCIFVGYAEHSKAFSFFVIEHNKSVAINSIIESRDAIFDENRFSSVPRPSQRSLVNGTEDSGGLVVPKKVTDEVVQQLEVPGCCKPLGCKSIFKRKLKVDGTVEKFKARLVIQGFKQKSGIDYFDTYAPVARISTIRLLIAMASIHNLIIHDEVVFSNGYLLNQADKCVYSKFNETGKGVIICLYVDDMLIFGTNQVQVDLTKEFLSSRFSIKDMGKADVILGIGIKH